MNLDFKHIDLTYILNNALGKKDIVYRMLKSYQTTLPAFIDEIRMTYENKNWFLLGNAAFHAKEITPIIGLKQLTLDLYELDMLCRKGKEHPKITEYVEGFIRVATEALEEINSAVEYFKGEE